ncbi:transglycosylase SLT domain-containing protein [Rhizobiaceae bacterium]|nr:transglycosylase SLT domain-containing protein [Rhizobiaceae bacterium]
MSIRSLAVAAFAVSMPLALAGCQNGQSGASSYGGSLGQTSAIAREKGESNFSRAVARKAVSVPSSRPAGTTVVNVPAVGPDAATTVALAPIPAAGPIRTSKNDIGSLPGVKVPKKVSALTKPTSRAKSKAATASASVGPTRRNGKVSERRERYAALIRKHAKAHGVPVKLAMAVVQVESMYRADAKGAAGEVGLMQILPRTARYIGYQGAMKDLYNPDTNIRYGMKYLGKAHKLGGGSTCGTILKYNAGHGAKKMNSVSRNYCNKVTAILRQS